MFQVDRTRRVSELIKRELAHLIGKRLNDDRINTVTITAVTVSKDLKQSTVYFSSMDQSQNKEKLVNLLNKSSSYLRHLLSQSIEIRNTPKLVFKYDESIQRGMELTTLIDNLNQHNDQQT